ncbi:MAG: hypothetical protein RR933_09180 [Oscillospiraceae bacterium]
MAIYDFDGTASRELGKLYDNDGTTSRKIGKVFDSDGAANKVIYKDELLLYDNGNQCISATGGWHAHWTYGYYSGGIATDRIDFGATCGENNSVGGGIQLGTVNTIDLTPLKILRFDVVNSSSMYNAEACVGFDNTKAMGDRYYGAHLNGTHVYTGTYDVNVENTSGNYYVAVNAYCSYVDWLKYGTWYITRVIGIYK